MQIRKLSDYYLSYIALKQTFSSVINLTMRVVGQFCQGVQQQGVVQGELDPYPLNKINMTRILIWLPDFVM